MIEWFLKDINRVLITMLVVSTIIAVGAWAGCAYIVYFKS